MDGLLSAIQSVLEDYDGEQITIRHLFYRLVSLGEIQKTENEYSKLVGHLAKWRRAGEIPFSAFADNTRWYVGSPTYDSIEEALQNTAETYRKNYWLESPVHLEIWTEKDAITSILSDAANRCGVRTFTCRGFASLSSLNECAITWRSIQSRGKAILVYYFGDQDASGVDIDRSIRQTMEQDFGIDFELIRAAVTPAQIEEYELPTRPQKKTDSRHKSFSGACVEIDAMHPADLKTIVLERITENIDLRSWHTMKATEQAERESLAGLVDLLKGGEHE